MVRQKSGKNERCRLGPHIGVSYWKRKVNRLRHKKPSKNFAAFIGNLFTALCNGKVLHPRKQRMLPRAFFADLLEHKSLTAVRKEKGRFRSYLLGALKYFLADERRRAMAIKRGKGQRLIPLEELNANERTEMEPSDPVTAEQIYERRWASTVLEHVLGLLKNEYVAAGNAALFDSLKQLLPDEPGAPSQADIAAQLGMTENAVRQAFHRFRQRYQSLLREEIAHTVATPGDVEDELRHLIAVVRA